MTESYMLAMLLTATPPGPHAKMQKHILECSTIKTAYDPTCKYPYEPYNAL